MRYLCLIPSIRGVRHVWWTSFYCFLLKFSAKLTKHAPSDLDKRRISHGTRGSIHFSRNICLCFQFPFVYESMPNHCYVPFAQLSRAYLEMFIYELWCFLSVNEWADVSVATGNLTQGNFWSLFRPVWIPFGRKSSSTLHRHCRVLNIACYCLGELINIQPIQTGQ